jgi:hypothetical protein
MNGDLEVETVKSGDEIDSEIRRLKYELMKHQYDKKILSLKSYIKSQQLNSTRESLNITSNHTTSTQANDYEDDQMFGSILFVNVVGDFEVWHFVLLTLFIWFLICKLIF